MPLRSIGVTLLQRYYGLLSVCTSHWLRYASSYTRSHVELNLVFFHPCRCPLNSDRCDVSVAVNCAHIWHALASIPLAIQPERIVNTRFPYGLPFRIVDLYEASDRDSSRHHEGY